jgi:hypothetical protein
LNVKTTDGNYTITLWWDRMRVEDEKSIVLEHGKEPDPITKMTIATFESKDKTDDLFADLNLQIMSGKRYYDIPVWSEKWDIENRPTEAAQ